MLLRLQEMHFNLAYYFGESVSRRIPRLLFALTTLKTSTRLSLIEQLVTQYCL
jgi:hypothetical protein